MLTLILVLPLLTALGLVAVPARYRVVMRLAALAATLADLVLALVLFCRFQPGEVGYQFVHKVAWIPSLGISYHVGLDGVNLGLIVMGAAVAFAAACASWEIKERQKEFHILLLLMTGGILGAFASLDLFFLYVFHELALVPTFIMIGVWGRGKRKDYAAFQITLYLTLGALIALIGLLALYLEAGGDTFDLVTLTQQLRRTPIAANRQWLIFPLLLFGFGILVSLWPFHTWAPLGYASAPTPTAMLHAGVVKKFGLYGLIRVGLPLLPEGAAGWMPLLAWLCLGNILYCALVAMRQRSLDLLIGNSSVAHMGFVFLGIASLSTLGVTGAVMVMVAHGFLAALSFGLAGHLFQQTRNLNLAEMGGLLRPMPFLGTVLVMAMLAGCGLPGFANFVGELMVLFGAWKTLPWFVVAAAWGGLVLSAVYMLRAVRQVAHGPVGAVWSGVADPSAWRKVPFVLMLSGLILLGVRPGLLTERIEPSVHQALAPSRISMPKMAQADPAPPSLTPAQEGSR